MLSNWTVCSDNAREQQLFPDLQTARQIEGEEINLDSMSRLVRFRGEPGQYYIKTYTVRGRGLRRLFGRSRIRAEWENLRLFSTFGIPTAEVVAFGEEGSGKQYAGVLVMRELIDTADLASLYRSEDTRLQDRQWVRAVIRRLADAVRILHGHGFVHNDLKWRNILVDLTRDGDPNVYIIDCPQGTTRWGPLLSRGRVKDLACLDKIAKSALSRTERLRFYLAYKEKRHPGVAEKREIVRILRFFSGRE